MKRSLRVVDGSDEPPIKVPSRISIHGRLASIAGTGDGRSGRRFVELLIDAGAKPAGPSEDAEPDILIVIRGAPTSPEARRRAEALEEIADLVLGSARPAFARLFASACARWVNS